MLALLCSVERDGLVTGEDSAADEFFSGAGPYVIAVTAADAMVSKYIIRIAITTTINQHFSL